MNPTRMLLHLRGAPWSRWLRGARIGLDAGDRWVVGVDRVVPWEGAAVDAWVQVNPEDLDRLLSREAPAHEVHVRVADGPASDRLKSARAMLAAASLGWCGPWPDPAADPTADALVFDAILNIEIGAADGEGTLFPAHAPMPPIRVRFTDGARPTWATVGLFPLVGAELLATGRTPPVRAMRALVLDALEVGRVARSLSFGDERVVTQAEPLPLATRVGAWVRLTRPDPAPAPPAPG